MGKRVILRRSSGQAQVKAVQWNSYGSMQDSGGTVSIQVASENLKLRKGQIPLVQPVKNLIENLVAKTCINRVYTA